MLEQVILNIRDNDDGDNLWTIMIYKQDLKKAKEEIENIRMMWDEKEYDCNLKELLEKLMSFKYEEASYYEMYI